MAYDVLLAGQYGRGHDYVRRWFERLFETKGEVFSVAGEPLRLKELDISNVETLRQAVVDAITRSCMILVDLTPSVGGGGVSQPIWNANVMYELGRADQIQVPVFRFCQTQFQPPAASLPFDITTYPVFWYQDSPAGLDDLCLNFERWFGEQKIGAYLRARGFISKAREVRSEVLAWPDVGYAQFSVVLNELMRVVSKNVRNMSSHIAESERESFQLELPDPTDMMDVLFAATLRTMGPADSYRAFSTPRFLTTLGTSESEFQHELVRAVTLRSVRVQRIVLLDPNVALTPDEVRVLAEHSELASSDSTYEVRYALSDRAPHLDRRHAGICHWSKPGAEETIVLKPRYQGAGEQLELAGIEYASRASSYVRSFEQAWQKSSPSSASLGPPSASHPPLAN